MKELSNPHNDYSAEMAKLEKQYFQDHCEELLPDSQETVIKNIYDSFVRNKPQLAPEEVTKLKEAYSRMEEWVKYREGIKPDFSEKNPSNENEVEIIKLRCEAYVQTISRQNEYSLAAVQKCQKDINDAIQTMGKLIALDKKEVVYRYECTMGLKKLNKSAEEYQRDIGDKCKFKPDLPSFDLDTSEGIKEARKKCEDFVEQVGNENKYDQATKEKCQDNFKNYLKLINNMEVAKNDLKNAESNVEDTDHITSLYRKIHDIKDLIRENYKEWNEYPEDIKMGIDCDNGVKPDFAQFKLNTRDDREYAEKMCNRYIEGIDRKESYSVEVREKCKKMQINS